ncbi:uncharacterized protein BDZ99DRAFT_555630 [Mytilinidion resinicola]|uniref:J domain-containing protein n=1 Tax=Mytilinidion resinicola TaxID=574789 RepID=A0A6A6YY16_9PEZI|nr:uncharacterized protein BDZ99DRAFT_555630 [Mytilinidion resinicola]KAF2812815.1 hypothetical protein BDZ99DRAFT_555630 [Mytilinidion resinicola]
MATTFDSLAADFGEDDNVWEDIPELKLVSKRLLLEHLKDCPAKAPISKALLISPNFPKHQAQRILVIFVNSVIADDLDAYKKLRQVAHRQLKVPGNGKWSQSFFDSLNIHFPGPTPITPISPTLKRGTMFSEDEDIAPERKRGSGEPIGRAAPDDGAEPTVGVGAGTPQSQTPGGGSSTHSNPAGTSTSAGAGSGEAGSAPPQSPAEGSGAQSNPAGASTSTGEGAQPDEPPNSGKRHREHENAKPPDDNLGLEFAEYHENFYQKYYNPEMKHFLYGKDSIKDVESQIEYVNGRLERWNLAHGRAGRLGSLPLKAFDYLQRISITLSRDLSLFNDTTVKKDIKSIKKLMVKLKEAQWNGIGDQSKFFSYLKPYNLEESILHPDRYTGFVQAFARERQNAPDMMHDSSIPDPPIQQSQEKGKGKEKESQEKGKGKEKESQEKGKGKEKESQGKGKGKEKESQGKSKGKEKERKEEERKERKEKERKEEERKEKERKEEADEAHFYDADPYVVIGVPHTTSLSKVKSVANRLLLKYHGDKTYYETAERRDKMSDIARRIIQAKADIEKGNYRPKARSDRTGNQGTAQPPNPAEGSGTARTPNSAEGTGADGDGSAPSSDDSSDGHSEMDIDTDDENESDYDDENESDSNDENESDSNDENESDSDDGDQLSSDDEQQYQDSDSNEYHDVSSESSGSSAGSEDEDAGFHRPAAAKNPGRVVFEGEKWKIKAWQKAGGVFAQGYRLLLQHPTVIVRPNGGQYLRFMFIASSKAGKGTWSVRDYPELVMGTKRDLRGVSWQNDVSVGGVASVHRNTGYKTGGSPYVNEPITAARLSLGNGRVSWFTRSLLGTEFGKEQVDLELKRYRGKAHQPDPPGRPPFSRAEAARKAHEYDQQQRTRNENDEASTDEEEPSPRRKKSTPRKKKWTPRRSERFPDDAADFSAEEELRSDGARDRTSSARSHQGRPSSSHRRSTPRSNQYEDSRERGSPRRPRASPKSARFGNSSDDDRRSKSRRSNERSGTGSSRRPSASYRSTPQYDESSDEDRRSKSRRPEERSGTGSSRNDRASGSAPRQQHASSSSKRQERTN